MCIMTVGSFDLDSELQKYYVAKVYTFLHFKVKVPSAVEMGIIVVMSGFIVFICNVLFMYESVTQVEGMCLTYFYFFEDLST